MCIFAHFPLSSFWKSRGHRCRPFSPPVLASIFIAHRVQQSHCSSIFHRVFLTHALALSASQFVRKKHSPRIYTSMHSGGFDLTELTYTRLEDNNLIRHRGDRLQIFRRELSRKEVLNSSCEKNEGTYRSGEAGGVGGVCDPGSESVPVGSARAVQGK